MQLPAVRALAQNHSLEELRSAEQALIEERPLAFEVGGGDEGEQLTHILGAIWIREQMLTDMSFNDALRLFAQRVRDSIAPE